MLIAGALGAVPSGRRICPINYRMIPSFFLVAHLDEPIYSRLNGENLVNVDLVGLALTIGALDRLFLVVNVAEQSC